MATIKTEPKIKNNVNSAKKADNSISNLMNMITSSMGDPVARGNAQAITTLASLFI